MYHYTVVLCQLFSALSIPSQCFTIPCTDDLISSKYPLPFSPNTRDSEVRFTYWPYAVLELKDVFFLCYSYRRESHKSYQIMWLFLHINLFSAFPLCDALFPFASFPPLTSQSPGSHASLDTFSSSQFCFHPDAGPMANQCRLATTNRVFPPPPIPPSATMELSPFSIHPTSPSTTNICEPPCAQPFFP